MPTLNSVYFESIKQLNNPNEEINIRILLCFINGIEKVSDFYLKKDENIKDLQRFSAYFRRFLDGEPIQYILKESEFLGNKFYVDNRVLIPRQESEELVVNLARKITQYFGEKKVDILDCCCGSGCLGISLAKMCKIDRLFLSDISTDALEVANINLQAFFPHAKALKSDGLDDVISSGVKTDVLIANPPYIFDKKFVDESANKYEPHLALYSSNKLEVYRKIFSRLNEIRKDTLLCGFEIGEDCVDILTSMIEEILPTAEYEFVKDINNKNRMLFIIIK